MSRSETTTRVLVAAVGIPIAVGILYLGGWALAALLVVVAVLSALEFFQLARGKGVEALTGLGSVVAALFILVAAVSPDRGPEAPGFGLLVVLAALGAPVAAIWARGVAHQPVLAVSVTLTGAIYTGALLSFGLFIRHLPGVSDDLHGAALVLAPVVLTWASDTFAYFVGRQWGTRKLIPSVSPGKTVQGSIGAILGTIAAAIAYSFLLARFPTYQLGILEAILFGLVVSVTAQVGDLAESLFKRDAGVKDSGKLLPGHGGALDRFDSLLFTLPLGYFFFRYVVGGFPGF